MTRIDYSGQTDIFDPRKFTWPIHVVGLGGIGSALILPLAKLGVATIHIWDFDEVEPHNIPAQLIYRPSDVGTPKAKAMAAFLERQEASCEIIAHTEAVDTTTTLEGVVISGVDSMEARAKIWEAVKFNPDIPFYMDGRIGGEQLQLLSLHPSDFEAIDGYEADWLFSDEEAAPLPCAARTVIHPPTVLAGLVIANLTLFARDLAFRPNIIAHLRSTDFLYPM